MKQRSRFHRAKKTDPTAPGAESATTAKPEAKKAPTSKPRREMVEFDQGEEEPGTCERKPLNRAKAARRGTSPEATKDADRTAVIEDKEGTYNRIIADIVLLLSFVSCQLSACAVSPIWPGTPINQRPPFLNSSPV
ncbi:hypothetical protein FRC11_010448, partial [Ceratobasidium sp. 423]